VNKTGNKKTYELDLRFFVPKGEIAMEVAEKILAGLQYEIAREIRERQVYVVSISDLELAQGANKKLPENAKSFAKGKNRELAIYGYPLSEALAELNEGRGESLFYFEGTQDERVGIEISDIRNLDQILEELQTRGLKVEQKYKSFETLVISK
jgi:hypothetical protein